MAEKKIRLFKIASEINVGKDAIVELLKTKGLELENKSTAVLSPQMVEAVYDKFKKEKRAVEVQREKVQKQKEIHKSLTDSAEDKYAEDKKDAEVEAEARKKEEADRISKEENRQNLIAMLDEIPEEGEDLIETVTSKKAKKEKVETKVEIKVEEKTEIIPSEEEKLPEPKEEPAKPSVGQKPKLRGLTVVGKIEVKKEPKPEKKGRKGKDNKDNKNKKDQVVVEQSPSTLKRRKKRIGTVDIAAEVSKKEQVSDTSSGKKGKKKKRKSIREQISAEDVSKAIKQTLAGMGEGASASSRAKHRAKKKEEMQVKDAAEQEEIEKEKQTLSLTEFVTTGDLANLMDINTNDIILKCMELGLMVTINQRLNKDAIELIAGDFNFEVTFLEEQAESVLEDTDDPEETLVSRPPIVTIMGHVDHGKTSLLDYIRNTKVTSGESGGITQHLGAYGVTHNDKRITFLDTPGHQAFTAMRARGAQITDIVILVIAADDSVMPQTKEAISHAQAAEVPIIVAINKIDRPEANPDRIKQQLSEEGVLVEDWGGKVQCTEISAKTGQNIDGLLENILLESEMIDIKANPDRKARATVVEAHMDKGLGPVATVVVQKGTLNVGDIFVAGSSSGRVRALIDEGDNRIKSVGPSTPIRIVGSDTVPGAGDVLVVVDSDAEAKRVATKRLQMQREQELRQIRHTTLDDISKSIALGGIVDLKIIIKADVSGSIEALSDELQKLSHDEVRVVILHKDVGQINESDVGLAAASDAILIGFHTSTTAKAKKMADREKVEIRDYEIIYDAINDVHLAVEGMLRPDMSEDVAGEAEIRAVFKLGRTAKIAGCKVISGKILRSDKARILREGLQIHESKIASLKREKNDAKEVAEGYECGIMVDGFNDYQDGDIIQTFKVIETKRMLDKV
jgi:translation initiation factor IF-2